MPPNLYQRLNKALGGPGLTAQEHRFQSKAQSIHQRNYPKGKEKILPALEFITGASAAGERGRKGSLLDLAFAAPLVGGGLRTLGIGIKGAKATGFIPRMLKVAEKGQPERSVVAVEMTSRKGGEKFIQPFYKSSGTSVHKSKKGSWQPFMGRSSGGWYMKGFATGKDKWHLAVDSPQYAKYKNSNPIKATMGPYGDVSNEIARLEKQGYFKHAGTAREGVGEFLPGEAAWGRAGKRMAPESPSTQYATNQWLRGYGAMNPIKGTRVDYGAYSRGRFFERHEHESMQGWWNYESPPRRGNFPLTRHN